MPSYWRRGEGVVAAGSSSGERQLLGPWLRHEKAAAAARAREMISAAASKQGGQGRGRHGRRRRDS